MLPDHYPSTDHLPFNSTCLAGRFLPEPPDRDPEGERIWLLLRAGELLIDAARALPRGSTPPVALPSGRNPLHIGRWDGSPCCVVALPKELEIPNGLHPENLGATEPQLPIELLTLGGCASQILHWQRTSRHCSCCGGATVAISGSWGRACSSCAYEHFPHIHPCVIVVIRRRGEVLLARKAGWPAGRYGLVAGFLDFGESMEEAVVREVREETGVEVTDVRYVGSQCWPFPSQLMAGFTAEYSGGEICVDSAELEDARWFPVDDLPNLPPKRSIARFLIDQHAHD